MGEESSMFSTAIRTVLFRPLLLTVLFSTLADQPAHRLLAQAGPSPAALDAATVIAAVEEIAAVVAREYLDPEVGGRVAGTLRQALGDGAYAGITSPDVFAARLTSDLLAASRDKHLAVTVVRRPAGAGVTDAAAVNRQEAVRRTNGGVQRVEILPGNVGYLNLTSFWRLEEARESIADGMRLLRRADALIIDLRQNSGGSRGSAAFLAGYMFVDEALPLFDVVFRSGQRDKYATPSPGVLDRDERRPLLLLTSTRTFSAGEGFAFLLQERGRAEVIGEQTPGAANPGQPFFIKPVFEVTVPTGRVETAHSGKNWEGTGVTPDRRVPASEALTIAHARALERLGRAAKN
jgi:C-terminal processing protease CtpA/Prc